MWGYEKKLQYPINIKNPNKTIIFIILNKIPNNITFLIIFSLSYRRMCHATKNLQN